MSPEGRPPGRPSAFPRLHIVSLPDIASIRHALDAGIDHHPLPYWLVTRVALDLAGDPHVGLRLPAIAGFGAMAVCLHLFVSRHTRPLYGLVAAAVPLRDPDRPVRDRGPAVRPGARLLGARAARLAARSGGRPGALVARLARARRGRRDLHELLRLLAGRNRS